MTAGLRQAAAPPDRGHRLFPRIAETAGDVVALAAIVAAVPLAVLAVGIPVALVVRAVLWIARLL